MLVGMSRSCSPAAGLGSGVEVAVPQARLIEIEETVVGDFVEQFNRPQQSHARKAQPLDAE